MNYFDLSCTSGSNKAKLVKMLCQCVVFCAKIKNILSGASPFTPNYLWAYNFMKQFLVNIIWYPKMHPYRNYKHTLKNTQNAHKMHNVCSICLSVYCFGFMSHISHC